MDNAILEVVLGLVLVYLTLALLVMKLQETLIGRWRKGRAKNMHELMREAVGRDENLKQRMFTNPMIFALSPGGDVADEQKGSVWPAEGPSAVPPDLFARVLLIELNDDGKGGHPASRFASPTAFVAEKAPPAQAGDDRQRIWGTLRGLLAGREADWPGFEAAIARWFQDIGDRSDGWYKRQSQAWSLRIAITVALLLNVDTFYVAAELSSDPDLRSNLATLAERVNTLFPGGAPATPAAGANAQTSAGTTERPEVRVSAHLVDAITRLNEAYFRDKSIATYQPDQRAFNIEEPASSASAGNAKRGVKPPTARITPACDGVEARVDPITQKAYLSNPGTWLLVLPQLLAFIEKQQVRESAMAAVPAASSAASSANASSASANPTREVNLANAYACLSDVSVWVRSAIAASNEASVRTTVQEASVALESAKSALLEIIDNQRPTYSLTRLFKSDPELFGDCAGQPGASLASIRVCMARGSVGQVRLPIGPFATNLRRQFCVVKFDKPGTAPPAEAEASTLSNTFCGKPSFLGNERLRINTMWLELEGKGAFVLWLLGCAVTGFFVALGAPFWFDVLGKVVNLRAAGQTRDTEGDKRRGQGTAPPPTTGGSGGAAGPAPAPFALARNGFEEQLVPADIVALQKQLGVPATGLLDSPTRTAIADFTRQQGREATDQLSFTVYDSIVGRSPAGVNVPRPSGRLALREVNENVQPLAKNLMAQLGFPGRIPPTETRYSDDLRALAVLYRYKLEAPAAPHTRAVVLAARQNRAALEEIDPKLVSDILSFTGTVPPALARDAVAPWLDWAIGELGQLEAGKATRAESNPRVIAYLDTVQGGGDQGDQRPWCGAFAAWVLTHHNAHLPPGVGAGVSPPPAAPLGSGQWCGTVVPPWGNPVPGAGVGAVGNAQPGDVVTFALGGGAQIDHVAFVLEIDSVNGVVWAIGGNQAKGTCVCVSAFKFGDVVDVRRP